MAISLEELARGLAAGERPALARALSLAERDPEAAGRLTGLLAGQAARAHVVGITGPPGAGKSTLAGALLDYFLGRGRRVAVLAVDPSSPLSGGALLGDRFRIAPTAAGEGAFIRSTATRGCLGGLNRAARQMVRMMDIAGFDLIVVETVGTGQSEVDVAGLADSLLVAFPPGLGDELQAIKAGILELADLLVVTKGDTAAAARACSALQEAAPMWRAAPPIHAVSAYDGTGIAALAEAVLERAASARTAPEPDGDAAPPSRLPALQSEIEGLRRDMEQLLPFGPAVTLARRATESGDTDLVIGVPGGDALQVGLATGTLLGLARARGLACTLRQADTADGWTDLVVRCAGFVGAAGDQR